MILVDERVGSRELQAPLEAIGAPVELTHLEFADVAFMGRGTGGVSVFVGIELKKIHDFVDSLNSDRLCGHQLPGLLANYDRTWLLIEGDYKTDMLGRVVANHGGSHRPIPGAPNGAVLNQRIINLAVRGGLQTWHCTTRRDTIQFIYALYRYWTDKEMDEHKSHLAIYNPDVDSRLFAGGASQFVRTIATLPGVKGARAAAAERFFGGSIRAAINAAADVWANLTTVDDKGKARRIGESAAAKIVEAVK